jgi:hypothetical protein
MHLRIPVRRFLQSTEKTEVPHLRFGVPQWVLARPLYRFQVFDLGQVPEKSRPQALQLELSQWTPFAHTGTYIGWHGQQAWVWGWDADKINAAMATHGLNPQRTHILPESVLHLTQPDGLHLVDCIEGAEAQLWKDGHLTHSRWWARSPSHDEWLLFQRDAGMQPDAQQSQLPAARPHQLASHPWIVASASAGHSALLKEQLAVAAVILALSLPTAWYGFSLLKLQQSLDELRSEQARLQQEAEPITHARLQALEHLDKIQALHALSPYPEQLTLMSKVAGILPQDDSYIKEWHFQQGEIKFTVSSSRDLSSTFLIGAIQQAGPFSDVKALPGNDPRNITFQAKVSAG